MSIWEKIVMGILEIGGAEVTRGSRRGAALKQLELDFDSWCDLLEQLPDVLTKLRDEYSDAVTRTTSTQSFVQSDPMPQPSLGLWAEEQLIRDLAADLDLDHRSALQNLAVAVREAHALLESLALRTADSVPRGDGHVHPLPGYAVPVNYIDQLDRAAQTATRLRARMRLAFDALAGEESARELLEELRRPVGA